MPAQAGEGRRRGRGAQDASRRRIRQAGRAPGTPLPASSAQAARGQNLPLNLPQGLRRVLHRAQPQAPALRLAAAHAVRSLSRRGARAGPRARPERSPNAACSCRHQALLCPWRFSPSLAFLSSSSFLAPASLYFSAKTLRSSSGEGLNSALAKKSRKA